MLQQLLRARIERVGMSESNYEKHHSVALQALNEISDIVLIMKIDMLVAADRLERVSYQQIR